MADGVVIAAPSSGSGKTVITLALLRALARQDVVVASAKVGPDYIDPRFHEAATGRPCFNLDAWAMPSPLLTSLSAGIGDGADLALIEGVMGLFDGPEQGRGSTADLAEELRLPVILVIDCSHQAQSIAALVQGFRAYRPGLALPAVILNRVASPRHEAILRQALVPSGAAVLGAVPRDQTLGLPSRHLGLVQAGEHADLTGFLDRAADVVAGHIDLAKLRAFARPLGVALTQQTLPPLGQHMAIARDEAFAFAYAHLLAGWRRQGASLSFFSPLADEAPAADADAIFLPGGYPELHAGRLSQAERFLAGLTAAAKSGRLIYGECGGYMVLGRALIDADGLEHRMADLLPVVTSFARRKLHLGYRHFRHDGALPWPHELRGHEFHYSTIARQDDETPLFQAMDAAQRDLGPMGLRRDRVMGSYAHVIA
ncbi:cobyrinate a,c-diamide synthase [Taklimakanibacter lacteus]|uniref:cobyrinate a,c-diamide synthase n=1 Tax=Taklimakanibacter lacteus TaxID=2268456 RepID=UPI000E6753CF